MKILNAIKAKINTGHEQSVELKKNIAVSIIIKLLSLVVGLVYLPTILTFIDKSMLGIIMTIDSFVSWLYLADIGIGNGLKNKLTEALAKGDKLKSRALISTAYISLFSILTIVIIMSSIVASFVNWNSVLKVDIDPSQLRWSVQYILFAFLLSFGVRLINNVLQAHQMSFLNSVTDLIIKVVKLSAIFIALHVTTSSLLKYVIIDHSVPLLVLIAFSIVLYNTKFKEYSPSFSHFRTSEIKNITSLGLKFFWVQIAAIVLFSTDNVIIARLFTTADVTVYNVARQYYSQVWVIFTFISVPLWSAYTKAYAREDYEWIKQITKKVLLAGIALSICVIIMFILYKPIIRFWLRGKIEVPVLLSAVMALSQIIMLLTSPFINFINGSGKIKLSMYLSTIIVVLNIPLSILFAKYLGMGIAGVIAGTVVCNAASLVISSIQYRKLVYQRAQGIWNQ